MTCVISGAFNVVAPALCGILTGGVVQDVVTPLAWNLFDIKEQRPPWPTHSEHVA